MPAQPASDTRLHPLQAIRAVRTLFANPGDTRQIFIIFRALRGRSGLKAFARFAASPAGAAVLRERRVLLDRLGDRGSLSRSPPGSLGRAYFDFMQSENLTADGLVQASQDWENDPVPADVKLFRERMRDAHDLTHVLTGYGRDPLGELCLLAFMYRQTRNLGQTLIVAMSWPRLPKAARRAVRQAWRNGKNARAFQCLDFEALLERPLADIRGELGIAEPTEYRALA